MAKNAIGQDEELKSKSKSEISKRLFAYLKPYKWQVLGVTVLMLLVMAVSLLNPYLLKIAIDKYIKNKNINGLLIIGALMILFNLLSMIASKKRIMLMSGVTNKILVTIRNELYTHIQKLSFGFFDSRPVGKILARVMGDVNALQDLFTNSVTSFIPELLTLICVTVIMFTMNYKLALSAIIILPLLAFSLSAIEIVSRKRWQIYRKKRSNLNGFIHEDFSGVRTVQSFSSEEKKEKSFKSFIVELMDSFVNAVKLNDLFWPLVELSWGIGTVVVYYYGSKFVDYGEISVGTLVAFTGYVEMFWRPIMNITNFYNTLITNFAAAERIFEIMDINPEIVNINGAVKMPQIKGNVEFKDVTFGYEDGTVVLDNVNFKVKHGETVALVGPTGAGKTTIVNLISRFYDPDSGEILIDGRNVHDVDIESLRSQMGIMLQDTFLFSATIMENIRYGKLDATDEEVMEAAKAVNAHEFIMKLENGYDTEVNERGSRLSVGERQLISFARALLANPRILILDEATSNIDTNTERLVQIGLKKILKGRTSFVIAHRLSTIRDADRIMVVDNGKIIEAGTHSELMKYKGLYYDLYMSQYRFLNEGA
ncbi:MAG TPA: multidrug ABC transporter ATP-binding protein [Clostridiaceae bacterium]|jgi:ATP-binding cassette subfamily B protein|nr:multidrug ABC transporter ATP-binding protein [Clostridiaceae bacterium]HBG39485.1 multidrug ABC transporter ATP-binding protein [Clostridiaceae bacterium]HBN28174.1 multidrug ABC transporter ATP-binding protein [Clostridiaceae bacterium]HBX47890.1 multidrug ABC transporter ATP-binding protein [Clostridiaceae bacterium]HCL50522.1 multidrug ABC transporter ATP-binding protein [Clostridiaceae bacterium]